MEGQRAQRLRSAVLGAAAITLAAPRARADDVEAIRIDYQAAVGCPDRWVFLSEVESRTARWREAAGPSFARRFVIEAEPRRHSAHGRVTVTNTAGISSVREVDGETCAEVVDALALMMALAIDPHASLTPVTPAGSPALTPAPPASPPAVVAAPVTPPAPPAPSTASPPAAPPPPPPSARWTLAAGAPATLAGGMAPSPIPGLEPFVEVARLAPSIWSPSARLEVRYAESFEIPTVAGTARVWRLVGGAEACPLRVDLIRDALEVTPCAAFDAGTLGASGTDTPRGRTETRAWLDAGGAGRLAWSLSSRVGVEIEAGATVPLLRYALSFPTVPGYTVYTIPHLAGFVGAGTSMRFW